MSAKVPAVVKICHQALREEKCVVIGLQSTIVDFISGPQQCIVILRYPLILWQGIKLVDFISGPRELLLKKIIHCLEHLNLCQVDGVKELNRKWPSATAGVSFKGRARKSVKYQEESDTESEIDSEPEPADSDDEFQICRICNSEAERKKLLQCSCCKQLMHPACSVLPVTGSVSADWSCVSCKEKTEEYLQQRCVYLAQKLERKKLLQCSCCKQLMHPACSVLPVTGSVSADWSCVSCKEKTEEYLQQRRVYLAQKLERYDEATERKSHILDLIHSLELSLNPLDDVIVQLGGPYKVAEITERRHRLVRASNGIAVRYEPRSTKDVTMEMVNINEKQSFMDGEKLVAIISEAGSAGVSLQADKRAINQFGRTHRSNHASAPEYRLLFGNLGGECRFASIIAKRLESLGALTQGDRRAGPSLRAYNYESPYAERALAELYNGIVIQSSLLVVPPGCSLEMPNTIEDFIVKGKAALVSVGLVKDDTNVGFLKIM
ncbi:PHD-type domain-containing protein [Heracleum sosnowskyi]|uniref:PHD-type domain-containing protein n=1 Tax=Heracleum sosnowskyi TaxID=360622 RepID=A0AAD8MUB7_9APIA|nr:PHD-type domain-containing protein [Heracleum sosnowskyi]